MTATARSTDRPVASATMRAIVQTEYGDHRTLQPGEAPRPEIGADEVLVEVQAAGMDRGTWHLMVGLPYVVRAGFGLRRPKQPVPGLDLAGTVVEVGAEVTRFQPGDEVLGIGQGSFAELSAAKEHKLVPKPAALSFEQAAVLPVSGLTALQAVRDQGELEPGQTVLVTGASGGVGSYAVQIAAALGGKVTGVASAAKADFVRGLGADDVVDYATEDFWDLGRRWDLIIDLAGNTSLSRLRSALTEKGTAVIVGGEEGGKLTGGIDRQARALLLSPFVGQRFTTFISKETGEDLAAVVELAADGRITPTLDHAFPLAEASEAMRRMEDGEIRGKVALTV